MRPKDKVVKTDQTSKHENFKRAQERNMQETRETRDVMKRLNYQNIKIDEGKEPQLNFIDQTFNKTIEQNFSKLMKDTLI